MAGRGGREMSSSGGGTDEAGIADVGLRRRKS